MAVWSRVLTALSVVVSSQALHLSSDLLRRNIADYAGEVIYTNANQTQNFIDVVVDGVAVSVLIDITLADLWVTGGISQSSWQGTGKTGSLKAFGDFGSINGSLFETDVTIAEENITEQAFIYASSVPAGVPSLAPGSPYGALGLGPSSWSVANSILGSAVLSPIDSAFVTASAKGDPFLTLLISPDYSKIGAPSFAGFLTIGETVDLATIFDLPPSALNGIPDLSTVRQQPKVTLGSNYDFTVSAISVGGKAISLTAGSVSATLSTTDGFITGPKYIADAIYGQTPNAVWSASDSLYHLPCDTNIAVSITIDGVVIPLDFGGVVGYPDSSGQCVGKFNVDSSSVNIVLGAPFAQNAYIAYAYSSFNNGIFSNPYYQFLPLTNSSSADSASSVSNGSYAHNGSYAQPTNTITVTVTNTPTTTVFLGASTGASTCSRTQSTPAPSSSSGSRPVGAVSGDLASDASDQSSSQPSGSVSDKLKHCLPGIIVAVVIIAVLGIAVLVWVLVSRRRRRGNARPSAYRTLHAKEVSGPVNVPLYSAEEERGHLRYADPYQDEEK